MRLKYYIITLRQMEINKPFVFLVALVLIIIAIFTYMFKKNIEPNLIELCKSNAKSIAINSTNKAVYEYIKDIEYEDLINIQKDEKNKITGISTYTMKMNYISTNIVTKINEELNKNIVSEIIFPIGTVGGTNIFGGYGPKIKVKTVPTGNVDVNFKSEFISAGINQTKHTIILEISTSINILAPLYTNTETFVNSIVVAETVIVGEIPSSYYDIDGESISPLDIIE